MKLLRYCWHRLRAMVHGTVHPTHDVFVWRTKRGTHAICHTCNKVFTDY